MGVDMKKGDTLYFFDSYGLCGQAKYAGKFDGVDYIVNDYNGNLIRLPEDSYCLSKEQAIKEVNKLKIKKIESEIQSMLKERRKLKQAI